MSILIIYLLWSHVLYSFTITGMAHKQRPDLPMRKLFINCLLLPLFFWSPRPPYNI